MTTANITNDITEIVIDTIMSDKDSHRWLISILRDPALTLSQRIDMYTFVYIQPLTEAYRYILFPEQFNPSRRLASACIENVDWKRVDDRLSERYQSEINDD